MDESKTKKQNNKVSIFIKIDLEGYDFNAIYGSSELLEKYDCSIIFEFSKMITNNEDYSPEKFNNDSAVIS